MNIHPALEVLHCDNHLLVVAKPACVPTAPDASGDASLFEMAKEWIRREFDKPGAVYLGLVHRLDRPVSGVVCFARTSKAAARLALEFRERRARKLYWGIVHGRPTGAEGLVEQWLAKDAERNRVTAVAASAAEVAGAKLARTRWRCVRSRAERSLLELLPETGRSHQLRVACASLGTPLLGDLKYGAGEPLPDQSIALHARELVVLHPTRAEELVFRAPLPRTPWWDAGGT